MTLIAGVNAYNHNASLSLVNDGRLVFAAEEERFNRIKHSDELPALALAAGLRTLGAETRDIDAFAYCWDWHAGVRPRIGWLARHAWDPVTLYYLSGLNRWHRLRQIKSLPRDLSRIAGRDIPFLLVPHHVAHAASAFLTSRAERAAILSVDGVGEWNPVWMGVGEGTRITQTNTIAFPHSLGFAYDAVCQLLGFRKREDVGKVMGLAAYGDPARYADVFRDWIHIDPHGGFRIDASYVTWPRYFGYGSTPMYSRRLVERLGPPRGKDDPIDERHKNIAAAMQRRFEEVMLHFARHLRSSTGVDHLCMAGGCALNCLANRRILEESGFDEVTIFPAASDAGAGAGAALYAASLRGAARSELTSLALGTEHDAFDQSILAAHPGILASTPGNLAEAAAELLAAGFVVGWVQGRMEFGPRALGQRSLLADPRDPRMKDIMNRKVKHREPFRPFAPVCTEEDAAAWFEGPLPSPWMMFAVPVKPAVRDKLGAVTHVDGTARLQTVSRAQNAELHELLKAFEKITGCPVLLNTSFNLAGQPVVCTAKDAFACFLATGIDALVIGDTLIVKSDRRSS